MKTATAAETHEELLAENKALRAEVRELKRLGNANMKTYLAFECDGCDEDPCIVCAFATALALAPKRREP